MAEDEIFEVGADRSITVQKAASPFQGEVGDVSSEESAPVSRMDTIASMIADPDSHIADISRLIALEMVDVTKAMSPKHVLDRGVVSQKDLNDRLKALRELQRTLTESDALSKKDVLNLDGEKFKFVFSELLRFFRKAMEDGGIDDQVSQNIMRQFGDLVRAHEAGLRIDLNKIGTGR